ncbi:hypothetical protein GN958_ATG17204 [Phytophthora infestans]|uniref:Uncharacterized protein n=1 Tax=Phytophthora infestans TaxID=4787 RepID=A0A8S9U3C3_PHYIN|nr:hypothetical protein GN958_ATG17204 [Phytophthora infestans]
MVSTRSSPRNSIPMVGMPTRRQAITPKRARRPRTRIQLADDDDGVNENDEIAVSSGVVVAAMRPALRDPADDSDSDNQA